MTGGAQTTARSERGEAGFSMVEMLVSLAVMGMAAWLLTAGIERIALSTQVADRADNRLGGLATAQHLLRQRLTMIQPVTGGNGPGFTGQADSVEFIARTADRNGPDALQHYRLERDADGDVLLLSVSTLDPRADLQSRALKGWAPLTLLSGTRELSIRYLGQNPLVADQHAVWQADWSHRAGLPMLVRISVDFADRRNWPDLIVHPLAATPEPCTRDAVTGGCAVSKAVISGDGAT